MAGDPPTGPPPSSSAGGPPPGHPPFPPGPAAPALPVVPVDRAPRWLVGVSVFVVMAVIAGGAFVVLRGGRKFPSSWDPRVAPIADWVAKARQLDYDHPVEVQFLSEAEYRKTATGGGDAVAEGTDEAASAGDTVAQLRALGLVAGQVDLRKANNTLSDSATLAFYDPESKKVFVRGTDMTPALRVTLAHELTHVLQDQRFDLQRIGDLPDGQASTLRALAEGDATRIEERYAKEVLKPAERAEYETSSKSSGQEADQAIEDGGVPPVLLAVFGAPYVLGPELVSYLDDTGGDEAIDKALADPPGEQVLFDPTVNGTPAARDEPLKVAAPAGTEKIEDGEFGPTAWYLLLAARMEPTTALQAANGLGDDGYVVYRKDARVCVQARAGGDTPADVTELSDALQDWVGQSPDGTASVQVVDRQVRFESCDPGAAAKAVGKVSIDLLQLPVLRTELYRQVTESGLNPTQATCFADGILERVTLAQILDGYLNRPEATQLGTEIGARCR